MHPDVLRDLHQRGRLFYEMFPGAKASDEWQRQRNLIDEGELANSSPSSTITPDGPETVSATPT
jgi:hypothetical protein